MTPSPTLDEIAEFTDTLRALPRTVAVAVLADALRRQEAEVQARVTRRAVAAMAALVRVGATRN